MKICVLQPSYEKSELLKDYAQNDPPRDLSHFAPEWEFTHIFLHKATVYSQIKKLKGKGFDIFVNLCEGHLEWDVPSIEVIHTLEMLDLPFTGPNSRLYEPGKESIKVIAGFANVSTPAYFTVRNINDVTAAVTRLRFPLFVKPVEGGDSFGVDERSLCFDAPALYAKVADMLQTFDAALIEEYVAGREFSVLVAADPENPGRPRAFRPVEFLFPEGEKFKTYDLKNTQYHPGRNCHVEDRALEAQIMDTARAVFEAYGGVGYCRLDLRKDGDGPLHVIDVNFTCSVFYPEGYSGTADYILDRDGFGAAGFLRLIVAEGVARWNKARKPYRLRYGGIHRPGIEAVRAMKAGEIIFQGEEREHRLVTRRWVDENWDQAGKKLFAQNAWPVDDEVYILWSPDPAKWAPMNHACDPNCGFDGLNIRALRDIESGEELSIDYAQSCHQLAEPFECSCGAANCRKQISGGEAMPVQERERRRRFACTAAQ